jgi:transcriptional/translational regulatory protein YebC/TACO1
VTVDEKDARAVLKLLAALEDNDDVQKVYANFEVADEVMAVLEAEEDL